MADQKKDRVTTIPGHLPINQETLDILVANIIPTSKYFEARFDHMEDRINRMQNDITDFRTDVNMRFTDINKRFNEMEAKTDKRFDEMEAKTDKRFDQMEAKTDKRFDQMINSIDKLTDKLDHRDERQRNFTLRMFTISITISILGVTGAFLKTLGLI